MNGQAWLILDRRILLLLPEGFSCGETPCRLNVAAGQTIREALESLDIRLPVAVIPIVNGRTEDLSYRLQTEDQVRLLIQLSGGC